MYLQTRKADFQVHSPRDPRYKDWSESKMTHAGLVEWCDALFDKSVDASLGAIAVTDHHDLLPGLLALERAIAKGLNSLDTLWVFPGMEITSKSGIQAILLLDPQWLLSLRSGPFRCSNLDEIQGGILNCLGQSLAAPAHPSKAFDITKEQQLKDLAALEVDKRRTVFCSPQAERCSKEIEEIARALNDTYKDRYVLLPNIETKPSKHGIFGNEAGRGVYCSDHNDWFYGGVISGGNKTDIDAISGKKVSDYGSRRVTCLRTSDQRGESAVSWFAPFFGDDKNSSWLKLSEPSATSIVQALISGHNQRVFDSAPSTADNWIDSVEIRGCEIFEDGKIVVNLNRELNTIIGGRGTGKSLILSALVRVFGVDKEWIRLADDESADYVLPAWATRHLSLFNPGGPLSGDQCEIEVVVVQASGARNRIVLKNPGNFRTAKWQLWVLGNKEEFIGSYSEFPGLIEVQPLFFLQGQMSAITDSHESQDALLALIEGPLAQHRNKSRQKLRQLSLLVKKGYALIKEKRGLNAKREKLAADIRQLSVQIEQSEALTKTTLTPEETMLVEQADNIGELEEDIQSTRDFVSSVHTALEDVLEQLKDDIGIDSIVTIIAKDKTVEKQFESLLDAKSIADIKSISTGLAALVKAIETAIKSAADVDQDITLKSSKLEKAFGRIRTRAESVAQKQKAAAKAIALTKELKAKKKELEGEARAAAARIKDIDKSGDIEKGQAALQQYEREIKEYSKVLKDRALQVSNDVDLKLLVKPIPGGQFDSVIDKLQEICSGCGVRATTWEDIRNYLHSQQDPAAALSVLFSTIIDLFGGDIPTSVPKSLQQWSLTAKILKNILERTDIEDWIAASVILADDRIDILYKPGSGKQPFPIGKASPGERAVELLRLSLKNTRGPIVIDQPEDDLDNQFLAENLVALVQVAKRNNQLIFASHNANLVVHGDSEKIHVFTNLVSDDTEVCTCKIAGTIDQEDVCDSIERIMEGGRIAFEQRRRKYHETIYPRRVS